MLEELVIILKVSNGLFFLLPIIVCLLTGSLKMFVDYLSTCPGDPNLHYKEPRGHSGNR